MSTPENRVDIRTRLIGIRQFLRDSYAAAAAMNRMGVAADAAGAGMKRATHNSFLWNQALFTLHRYVYNATLAMTALGAVAAGTGIKFNASIERTTIALEYLTGSEIEAQDQLKEFLRIARETTFLPNQVIGAGQQLRAFGFTAEETNRTLRATAASIAALNRPQADIDRIILAFVQMRAKGRLMGEELRQLANANIPVYKYLAAAFGENVTQLNRIGDARIPAQQGIEAILAGLEADYGGISERIAGTTSGQFEILKGDIQAILGGGTITMFNQLAGGLQRVTNVTGQMFNAVVDNQATFYDLVEILDDATGNAYHFQTAIRTTHDFLLAFRDSAGLTISVLMPFVKLLLLATWATLEITTAVLGFINLGGEPLVWVLRLIVAWMVAERIALKLIFLWTNRATAAKIVHAFWTRRLAAVIRILTFWKGAETIATQVNTVETRWNTLAQKHAMVMEARRARMLKGAMVPTLWAVVAAQIAMLATNPFFWLAVAGIALAAALTFLWFKFDRLRPIIAGLMLFLSPMVLLFLLLAENIERVGAALDSIGGKFDALENWLPDWGQMSGLDIAGALFGGGGGVEQVAAPRVAPTGANWEALSAGGAGMLGTLEAVPVNIDGREVAEIVFRHKNDRIARR